MGRYDYDKKIITIGGVFRITRPPARKLPVLEVKHNDVFWTVGTFSSDEKADLFIDTIVNEFAQKGQ